MINKIINGLTLTLLCIGCCNKKILIFLSLFIVIILIIDASFITIIIALFLLLLFLIGDIFFRKYWKQYLDTFIYTLVKSGIKDLNINPKYGEAIPLIKKTKACNTISPYIRAGQEYEISIIFLENKFLSIYEGCPKYHMLWNERKNYLGKWNIKYNCMKNREFYYSYIHSVDFDEGLKITMNSGDYIVIPCDKPASAGAIKAIRSHLRESERRWQMLHQKED